MHQLLSSHGISDNGDLHFSIGAEFWNLQPQQLSMNRLRFGFQRPALDENFNPILDENGSVVRRATVAVLSVNNIMNSLTEFQNRPASVSLTYYNLDQNVCGGMVQATPVGGDDPMWSEDIIQDPRLSLSLNPSADGSWPYIFIHFMIPARLLAPSDEHECRSCRIWYEFESAGLIKSMMPCQDTSLVEGVQSVRHYVWPDIRSQLVDMSDYELGRIYPAPNKWGVVTEHTTTMV
ncbi:MAG: hypothetical protein AB9M53_06305 [Leptothrix sp. (in: b-proteobacteria)]